jgi:hypothetical protein
VTGFALRPPCVLAHPACAGIGCPRIRAFSLEYPGFAVPPGFLSAFEASFLMVQAFPSSLLGDRRQLGVEFACTNADPVDRVDVPRRSALSVTGVVLHCVEGPLSGMLFLRWTEGRIAYQVGTRAGDRPNTRSLLVAIADNVQLVPTEGP